MSQDHFVTLNQVVHHLRQNRHESEAAQLEALLTPLQSDDEAARAAAAESVVQMSSVRVLGHAFINELSLPDWYRLLDQMADSVRAYRKLRR